MGTTIQYLKQPDKKSGSNYSVVDLGALANLHEYEFEHPRFKRNVPGKVFLHDFLNLTGMEVSVNKMPPGIGVPFYHSHKQNEELYIFVQGSGQFQVDGEVFDVKEGSAIRVAPGGVRCWRNNGKEDLVCICIQAKDNSLAQHTFDDGIPHEQKVEWPQ